MGDGGKVGGRRTSFLLFELRALHVPATVPFDPTAWMCFRARAQVTLPLRPGCAWNKDSKLLHPVAQLQAVGQVQMDLSGILLSGWRSVREFILYHPWQK